MAEDEGFEPPQTESESGVLPLHKSSIFPWGTLLLYPIFRKCQGQFLEFPGFFSGWGFTAEKRKRAILFWTEKGGPGFFHGQLLADEFAGFPWYSKATPHKCVFGRMAGGFPHPHSLENRNLIDN